MPERRGRDARPDGHHGRRRALALAAGLAVALSAPAASAGAGSEQSGSQPSAPAASAGSAVRSIDQRSYELGIIGAFAEIVHAGVKTLALSEVMTPEWCDGLIDEAERIAGRNHVQLFRETDFLVTDLFPASLTAGKHVLLIYQGETLAAYQQLKADKARLVARSQYEGPARVDIARRFGRLLSYPDWKIDELLRAK